MILILLTQPKHNYIKMNITIQNNEKGAKIQSVMKEINYRQF